MITFPYKVKHTTANTTYVEPIDQKDLDNLCEILHSGYSRLVEMAIDNTEIFKQRCVPYQGQNRVSINKSKKIGLSKCFSTRHPALSVNPNPKNIKGLKGQTFFRFINGNLNKLYRVKNKNEDLSEELLTQYNKMIELIEKYIDMEWRKQDEKLIQKTFTTKQINSEINQVSKFLNLLDRLKINHYNHIARTNNNKNKQLTKTGLFTN